MTQRPDRGDFNLYAPNSVFNGPVGPRSTQNLHTYGVQSGEVPAEGGPVAHTDRRVWSSTDIGVLTVLSKEARAVTGMLADAGGLTVERHEGATFDLARIDIAGETITVVHNRTLMEGQHSAVLGYERLHRTYSPAIIVLVGIAGAIHPNVKLGDVVVSHEVVYYDLRKETGEAVLRRGRSHPVPAVVRRALNEFFVENGEPCPLGVEPRSGDRPYLLRPGIIGSGEVVLATRDHEIRCFLHGYNNKVLAVEMEAGGIAQAFYESMGTRPSSRGWLTIRGIADYADVGKDDRYHDTASQTAAAALHALLPFLKAAG